MLKHHAGRFYHSRADRREGDGECVFIPVVDSYRISDTGRIIDRSIQEFDSMAQANAYIEGIGGAPCGS